MSRRERHAAQHSLGGVAEVESVTGGDGQQAPVREGMKADDGRTLRSQWQPMQPLPVVAPHLPVGIAQVEEATGPEGGAEMVGL